MRRTRIILALFAILSGSILSARDRIVVTAPEAPFPFEPLEMFVFPNKDFPITKYGAKPGDVKANTAAFAKAMAACNKAGGGRVVVPAGEWLTGPIHFKSNCNLYLGEGAKVVFEDDLSLYYPAVQASWEGAECMNVSPLVYAFECENIAISGPGMLAPKMDFWRTWFARPDSHIQATRQLYAMCSTQVPVEDRHMEREGVQMRPHLIHFNRCTNIQLDGFKIRESPFWTIHTFMCKDVWAHHLDVYAHGHNNDGIDLEMTQHAIVEDCTFDQGDDAVVIKAGRNQDGWALDMPTQDVVVRRCEVVQGHCLLGIGSEMSGGVRRVYMHDCHSGDQVYRLFYIKTRGKRIGDQDAAGVRDRHGRPVPVAGHRSHVRDPHHPDPEHLHHARGSGAVRGGVRTPGRRPRPHRRHPDRGHPCEAADEVRQQRRVCPEPAGPEYSGRCLWGRGRDVHPVRFRTGKIGGRPKLYIGENSLSQV